MDAIYNDVSAVISGGIRTDVTTCITTLIIITLILVGFQYIKRVLNRELDEEEKERIRNDN